MSFEERFKQGLKSYIEDNSIDQTGLADKAGIPKGVFSKLLNTRRRVYSDEAAAICTAVGLTLEAIVNYKARQVEKKAC
ncbi:MAG: helix-turn-helix transcriptional regulator [Clostridiales bacterium]|jgi:plasmid maintenance system antidote protein VapI|nr:helix-turn-helix transcriptional regulator [Eubacteriales bacterium]MDH7567271.1 helix-turn-helix transcriptional regulator [Clostridiales bacterium]